MTATQPCKDTIEPIKFCSIYSLKTKWLAQTIERVLADEETRRKEQMTLMDEKQAMPLVSAVIITHNRKDLVLKAIESAQKQTYQNMEIIVVDDASSDGTHELLESGSKKGQFQYIYIPKEESKGGNHARNTGILAAKGKYVALLDDDDEWLPEKTEKQVAMMESHPECGVCHCGKIWDYNFGERQTLRDTSKLLEGDLSREILIHVVCTTSVMMVDRNLLLEAGLFDEALRYWQEYELCIRLFQKTRVAVVRENLVLYRVIESDKNRLTNKVAGWEEAVTQIYKKHADEIGTLTDEERRRMELFMYHDGASRCNMCGDKKRLRKYLFKTFKITKSPKDLFKAVIGQYELRKTRKKTKP